MRRVVLSIVGVALIFLGLSTASSEAHADASAPFPARVSAPVAVG